MALSDRAEEILETLWIELIEQKKERCDIRILKDDEVIEELVEAGYVRIEEEQIRLSEQGKEEARGCIRRHRLAERLLTDVLDIKKGLVHQTSCKFEHLLHKGLDDNICTLLGHPRSCPHGRPIPEGHCCRDSRRLPQRIIMPLTELEIGRRAEIAYLQTTDNKALQKLIAMGTLPNMEIVLLQRFPSYVFQIAKSKFAVDRELASQIYVRSI